MSFNVVVKSDPKGEAKGRFQCEFHDNGLTLKKGKKQTIEVPIGTPASYLGKNKLLVEFKPFHLEIVVQKFGSYQNRLAKDLAEYIAGDRAAPILAHYSMEWFCYIPSLLPVGIPIITLGGAIPGAIGFGLAAVCFGIAQQEKLPIWGRLLIMMGINVAAYTLLFAVLAKAFAPR